MCLFVCFLWTCQYNTLSRPVKHKLLLIWFISQLSVYCNEIIHTLSLGWSQWGDRPIIDRYAFHIQMSLVCAGKQELGCSCSVPFHTYRLLFILSVEAIGEQCVFFGCERSQWWLFSEISSGSLLVQLQTSCLVPSLRINTDGSTICPWFRRWWITLQAYIFPWGRCPPDVLRWLKCWKAFLKMNYT